MKKEKINIIKLIPFFVPLKDKTLHVYGKIYSSNNVIYWDVDYYYKPTPDAEYSSPSKTCSSIEEAISALDTYMKSFTEDYVSNRQF
jgi:hypothetical protein